MKKKRILFLIQLPPPVHGVSTINKIVTENPYVKDYFVSFILELRFSSDFSELRKMNLKKIIRFFRFYNNLKRKLEESAPDMVYFSFIPVGIGFFRDYLFLRLIKRYNSQVLLHLHNRGISKYAKKMVYRYLYNRTFNNVSLIHVSRQIIEEEFGQMPSLRCKKYIVQNTCIPFENSEKSAVSGLVNIVYLSNLFPEKGIFILLKAYSRILEKYSDVQLHIFGSSLKSMYIRKLLKLLSSAGFNGKAFYHGYADERMKATAFSNCDIFIFPSYFSEECMPLAVLEAMQAGKPVIATRIGALSEIIDNGKEGILIEPGNISQLVSSMDRLISDVEIRKRLGSAARKRFYKEFSKDIFDRNIFEVFKQISQY